MDDHLRRRLTGLVLGALAVVVAAVLAACSAGAAASPTPPEVVPLLLRVTPPDPPGPVACPMALLADVRLEVQPAAREPIVAIGSDGSRTRLVFRSGTQAAWHVPSRTLQISTPEGQRLTVGPDDRVSFGGGLTFPGEDDVFFACTIEG